MTKKKMKAAISAAVAAAMIAAPTAAFAAQDQAQLAQAAAQTAVVQQEETTAQNAGFWSWLTGLFSRMFGSQNGAAGQQAPDDAASAQQGAQDQAGGPGQMGQPGAFGGQSGQAQYASEPTEVATSSLASNSAEALTADYAGAETIVMSDANSDVTIKESGTYIITGTCSDGNIKVKKGTQDVVLILKDLTLTSTTGATLSLNKGTETKVIIEGTVTLTDAEDLANEESDDFDGAAIKAKAGSAVVLTGSGTLIVNGSCKHGIKVSGTDADDIADGYGDASFIIDGGLSISITSADDGINSGTDLTIKSGSVTVSAGDDGIKADYILTIGEEGEAGPTIKVEKSGEALEGAVVNICSGQIDVTASDDGINAANSDLSDYTFSINIMGGTVNISSGADGLDSNGNINILGGLTTIVKSAANGGEGGMDYQGSCYVEDGCLVNPYGVTMDSGMGGFGGQMGGFGSRPDQMDGQLPGNMDGFGNKPNQTDGQMPENMGSFGGHGSLNQGTRPDWSNADGEQPDSSTGETPQMPQQGQLPGQMPGQMGPQNGFGPHNGTRPNQNGQMPGQTDGQVPGQMNGQAPGQMNGSRPSLPPQFEGGNGTDQSEELQMPDGFQQNVFFSPLTSVPEL